MTYNRNDLYRRFAGIFFAGNHTAVVCTARPERLQQYVMAMVC